MRLPHTSTTRVPRRRSGPTADANAGAKNGIHHLSITAPGAQRSRCAAVRRHDQGPIESRSAAVGKRGRGACSSSWLVPGKKIPGYWRVNRSEEHTSELQSRVDISYA